MLCGKVMSQRASELSIPDTELFPRLQPSTLKQTIQLSKNIRTASGQFELDRVLISAPLRKGPHFVCKQLAPTVPTSALATSKNDNCIAILITSGRTPRSEALDHG